MAGDSQPDYRQDPPESLPGTMPTCPLCGVSNQTDPQLAPISRMPQGAALARALPYLCGACWMVFDGTDNEWRRMAERRAAYAQVMERERSVERTPSTVDQGL